MIVLYALNIYGIRKPSCMQQVMNGCLISALDSIREYEPSDCIWIVPGTFDSFI